MADVEDNNDLHYLRHVTSLGERLPVVAHRAVFSTTGIKLVGVGMAINRSMLDKLARHRLLPPIDDCLTVEQPVSPQSLRDSISALLDTSSSFAALVPLEQRKRVLDVFATIPLSMPLAFKLTVAREERPDIFDHSLQVALLVVILLIRDKASMEDLRQGAAAGMFHDIGLLHLDPAILRRGKSFSEEDRRQLYSHPIIAHLILGNVPEWPSRVADAVLQHHERLDGSGYPRGLAGAQIGELGQVLAVAELAATLLARQGRVTRRYVEIVLRMNVEQLPLRHTEPLLDLLSNLPAPPGSLRGNRSATILPVLVQLSIAFNHWRSIRENSNDRLIVPFVDMRIERLTHALADVGVDLEYWTTFDTSLEADPCILDEIEAVASEASWQIRSIAQETRRKWSRQSEPLEPGEVNSWLETVEAIDMGSPG